MLLLFQTFFGVFKKSRFDLCIPVPQAAYIHTVSLHPVTHILPGIKFEPLSITIHYRNASPQEATRDAFSFGQWCGERSIPVILKTPGDGTLRLVFEDANDLTMFKLSWSDALAYRENNRIKTTI